MIRRNQVFIICLSTIKEIRWYIYVYENEYSEKSVFLNFFTRRSNSSRQKLQTKLKTRSFFAIEEVARQRKITGKNFVGPRNSVNPRRIIIPRHCLAFASERISDRTGFAFLRSFDRFFLFRWTPGGSERADIISSRTGKSGRLLRILLRKYYRGVKSERT